MKLPLWLHKLGSPPTAYAFANRALPWIGWPTLVLLIVGVVWGLFVAPPDYQQGESVRIIYVHVPSAWMSMFVYVFMATSAAIGIIWRMKVADAVAASSAPIGATFTVLALFTGSLWGKPMWGTWWVWDARLTSELVLLFLYLGVIALQQAIEDPRNAARASGLLAIVGVINIPIIHYSVEWWNTLHQGATITKFDKPSMDASMLWPLLVMALAFQLLFVVLLLLRLRNELLERESGRRWVQEALS